MQTFTLTAGQLTLIDLRHLYRQPQKIKLAKKCYADIESSLQTVKNILDSDKTVYGVNTGVGLLANQKISNDQLIHLQRNLVLSHACGVGEYLEASIVKLVLLLKINSLARGFSGVRPEIIDHLIALYNADILPCIPRKGSVGASGDLAPLAHLSCALLGVGEVYYQQKCIPAAEGLQIAEIAPVELQPKEGLALLNGVQVSTAIALKALFETEKIFTAAMIAGSLSVDASLGSDVPFDERIQTVRGHKGQQLCAQLYGELLHQSELRQSHKDCDRVQDPYSLRCQPQVMGACYDHINFAGQIFLTEANAVSDNPLVFSDSEEILSGGNFHGEPIAMSADTLALAIAEIGALSERRVALLVDKHLSQLPAFLVEEGGLNSGFMIPHVTCAAVASENKSLAHPSCVDSMPTSANQEDHVSMATHAAQRLLTMIDNSQTIIAIELLAACQGLDFRQPLKTSVPLQEIYQAIRKQVPTYDRDRYFAADIATMKNWLGDVSQPYFQQYIQQLWEQA